MLRMRTLMLAFGIAMLSLHVPAYAACDGSGCDGVGCDAGCGDCCVACPQCNTSCKTCKLTVDEDEVSKHCWKVECEEICVPRFVFPWQKTCCNPHANNGACIRTVKVLKKHSYKCPECSYSWSAEDAGCCGGCCDDGCSSCGDCNGGCDSGCSTCDGGCAAAGTWMDSGSAPAAAEPQSPTPAGEGAPVPAVPEAPSADSYSNPYTQPVNNQLPGVFHSTSRNNKATVLPVRFIRAAKAKGKAVR